MPTTPIVPYKQSKASKKEQVANMFNQIAPKYDFLNHFLSMGIDIWWRHCAIVELQKTNPQIILDVATGTADLALMIAKKLQPLKIIGIDISNEMLAVGQQKIQQYKGNTNIELLLCDAENMPFAPQTFDAVTVAFGVRNFENVETGLAEIYTVLKNNGKLIILEFSKPSIFPIKQFFGLYFRYVLPLLGKIISKDKTAYTYLPQSVQAFPQGNDFCNLLIKNQYKAVTCKTLSFGICSLYIAQK